MGRLTALVVLFILVAAFAVHTGLKNKAELNNHREILTTETFELKQIKTENGDQSIPPGINSISGAAFFPSAKFASWRGFHEIRIPTSYKTYSLEANISDKQVRNVISYLSKGAEVKKNGFIYLAYTADKTNKSGSIILFDAKTGQFSYRSTNGIKIISAKSDSSTLINEFIKHLGITDETIKITATYKRKSAPGNIFYEIKRDWKLAGLPILNPIGLLNLEDTRKIKDLSFAPDHNTSPKDNDIYSTSDNSDNLARKADFNTMTIELSEKDQKIVSAYSTLRRLTSAETISDIISYKEATEKLIKGKDATIFTSPAGEGFGTPWEKIYPGKMAESKMAEVTDSALAYLEQMPGIDQQKLEPYYIFRGKATLTSGYDTYFVALVPANKNHDPMSQKWFDYKFFPIANAQQYAPSQKQGTFTLTEATPDPFPPTPTPNYTETCIPKIEDLNPRSTIQSSNGSDVLTVGRSHIAVVMNKVQISRRGWWYFTPAPNSSDAILQSDYTKALILIQSVTNQTDFRRFQDTRYNPPGPMGVLIDYQRQGADCPIRITGESPTIFVYAPAGSKLAINPVNKITYSDPALNHAYSWNVAVDYNGGLLIDNSYLRDYLYYEYDPAIKFSRPKEGWRISRSDTSRFANQLAAELGLNRLETTRLKFELFQGANQVKAEELFVGIIDKSEIDNYLPLNISRNDFALTRLHFYVDHYKKTDKIDDTKLKKIIRGNKMILEIGSYSP